MAMAADAIELFECLKEDVVTQKKELVYATLGELHYVSLGMMYNILHLLKKIIFTWHLFFRGWLW